MPAAETEDLRSLDARVAVEVMGYEKAHPPGKWPHWQAIRYEGGYCFSDDLPQYSVDYFQALRVAQKAGIEVTHNETAEELCRAALEAVVEGE